MARCGASKTLSAGGAAEGRSVVAAVTAVVRMTKEKSLALKSVFMIYGLTRDPVLFAGQKAAGSEQDRGRRRFRQQRRHGLRGGPRPAQDHTPDRCGGGSE